MSQLRYEWIEEIVSQGRITRKELRRKVNQRAVQEGEKTVSESQIDKDIRYMRERWDSAIITYRRPDIPGYEFAPNSRRKCASNLAQLDATERSEFDFALDILGSKADLPLLQHGLDTVNRVINQIMVREGKNHIMTEPYLETKGSDFIPKLYDAILNRRAVIIDYQKLNEQKPSTRTFSPYLLREYRGFWYVIGYNHNHNPDSPPVIILALDRMRGIRPANVRFYEDKEFNRKNYFKNSLGVWHAQGEKPEKIEFWASKDTTHFLEVRKYHHSQQKVKSMKLDGRDGFLFSMTVFISDEVVRLFLERGGQIKALKPASLVGKIKETLKQINKQYS